MKRFKNIFILLAIITLLLVLKFFCGTKKMEQGAKPGGPSKMPVKVSVQVLKGELVSPVYHVSGSLLANEQVQLNCEAQGLVKNVLFKEGARVTKGALLMKINDADLQAQLKKALANKKLKEDNAKRNEVLLKKEAMAQADYDFSVNELNAINADIDYLKEMIRKTEIRAPFNGNIGLRTISEGAYVTLNTNIATLQDVSKLKIDFSVPEKYALKVNVGDEISFTVSGSDEVYTAKIYARDAAISSDTRSVKMRALCNNNSGNLMPGLFATITMNLGSDRNSYMIPTQALVPILKGQKVYVVQGDSAIEKMVKTGFRSETQIEITDGLNAGDSLIVEGIMYMKTGVRVKVGKSKL